MYYNARYYDPKIGRFIQADSIVPNATDPQEFNRYSYVNNNPIKFTDPTGHKKKKWWHKALKIVSIVAAVFAVAAFAYAAYSALSAIKLMSASSLSAAKGAVTASTVAEAGSAGAAAGGGAAAAVGGGGAAAAAGSSAAAASALASAQSAYAFGNAAMKISQYAGLADKAVGIIDHVMRTNTAYAADSINDSIRIDVYTRPASPSSLQHKVNYDVTRNEIWELTREGNMSEGAKFGPTGLLNIGRVRFDTFSGSEVDQYFKKWGEQLKYAYTTNVSASQYDQVRHLIQNRQAGKPYNPAVLNSNCASDTAINLSGGKSQQVDGAVIMAC